MLCSGISPALTWLATAAPAVAAMCACTMFKTNWSTVSFQEQTPPEHCWELLAGGRLEVKPVTLAGLGLLAPATLHRRHAKP